MALVEVYSSPFCPYCWRARWLLHRLGVPYRRIPIRMYLGLKLPTCAFREMVARTGGDATIPQVFVDGQYLGTDDTLFELHRQGVLLARLRGEPPTAPPAG